MTSVVDDLDPAAYVSAMAAAAGVLEAHAGALDVLDDPGDHPEQSHAAAMGAIHGSPIVPMSSDGTGSDLAATLAAAVASAAGARDFAAVTGAMTRAAADAARGRGGRALADFVAGLGEVFANADRIDGPRFALGLEAAAERLAPGDDGRHPGGFASVANAAADAALDSADRGSQLGETILAAAGAGIEELERGPVLDARLASTGSVDSAAAGLLLMLDALASVVTGEPLPEPPEQPGAAPPTAADACHDRYELRCELVADDPGVEAESDLEAQLMDLCDTFGLDRMPSQGWSLEVVTASPGAVVEALAARGRIREVRIAVMATESGSVSGEPLVGAGG